MNTKTYYYFIELINNNNITLFNYHYKNLTIIRVNWNIFGFSEIILIVCKMHSRIDVQKIILIVRQFSSATLTLLTFVQLWWRWCFLQNFIFSILFFLNLNLEMWRDNIVSFVQNVSCRCCLPSFQLIHRLLRRR